MELNWKLLLKQILEKPSGPAQLIPNVTRFDRYEKWTYDQSLYYLPIYYLL